MNRANGFFAFDTLKAGMTSRRVVGVEDLVEFVEVLLHEAARDGASLWLMVVECFEVVQNDVRQHVRVDPVEHHEKIVADGDVVEAAEVEEEVDVEC